MPQRVNLIGCNGYGLLKVLNRCLGPTLLQQGDTEIDQDRQTTRNQFERSAEGLLSIGQDAGLHRRQALRELMSSLL
jgi:ABC-type lipopolysaccharide export system ATPase subunit